MSTLCCLFGGGIAEDERGVGRGLKGFSKKCIRVGDCRLKIALAVEIWLGLMGKGGTIDKR